MEGGWDKWEKKARVGCVGGADLDKKNMRGEATQAGRRRLFSCKQLLVPSAQQSSISCNRSTLAVARVARKIENAKRGVRLGPYFSLEALHQDGHQQVEEDVVAEGHEGDEVEGGQRRGGRHAVVEHRVPVLLGEDLQEL